MARTHPYTQAPNNEHARLVASPSGHPAWTPLHKGIATNCTVRSTSAGEENLYTVPPACTSARMHTLGEKVPGRKHPQRDVTTGHNAQRTATTFGLVTDDWHIRTLRPLSVRDLFFKGKKKQLLAPPLRLQRSLLIIEGLSAASSPVRAHTQTDLETQTERRPSQWRVYRKPSG